MNADQPESWTDDPFTRSSYRFASIDDYTKASGDPSQASLDTILAATKRVRAYKMGTKTPLLDTSLPAALQSLSDALRINEGPYGTCACAGADVLEFIDEAGQVVLLLGIHHGQSIRWNVWTTDAKLRSGQLLLNWLNHYSSQSKAAPFDSN